MKYFIKILVSLVLIMSMLTSICACSIDAGSNSLGNGSSEKEESEFYINGETKYILSPGDSITLTLNIPEGVDGVVKWESSHSRVEVDNGVVTAVSAGTAVVKATLGDYSDSVIIVVIESGTGSSDSDDTTDGSGDSTDGSGENTDGSGENTDGSGDSTDGSGDNTDGSGDNTDEEEYIFGSEYPTITVAEALELAESYSSVASTKKYYLVATVTSIASASKGNIYISDDSGEIYAYGTAMSSGLNISDVAVGDVVLIYGPLRNYRGTLEIEKGTIIAYYTPGVDTPTPPESNIPSGDDPYENVDSDEFYENYKPATSYEDAYYRTQNGLMSGTIAEQDQAPTISAYQPKQNGKFIRNTEMIYSEDGNTYYVVDAYGEVVMEIYKGGAYIMLEEVAAYVFAFGEPPANQTSSKNTSPSSSVWGIYLRLNHTAFSGSTSSYPYEPELPNISGCGGTLNYYEMDIGTTGTDCDPEYTAAVYNNGSTITRGAARIVYACEDDDGNGTIDHDERYVFYTYNHYNDFQEYLNYEGGWGEMFGNITGGGKISSKTDYNPTDYEDVILAPITKSTATGTATILYCWFDKEKFMAA